MHVDLQVAEFSIVPLQQKAFICRMKYIENTLSKSNDQVCFNKVYESSIPELHKGVVLN